MNKFKSIVNCGVMKKALKKRKEESIKNQECHLQEGVGGLKRKTRSSSLRVWLSR